MENTKKIPSAVPITAVIIFVLMFVYAAFLDPSFPEKTVKGFYQSYFSQDYQEAAEDLSVLWAKQLVPEYATASRAELMEQRSEADAKVAEALEAAQVFAPATEGTRIQILMDSIVKGKSSALVAFNVFTQDSEEPVATKVALLAKEGSSFKLVETDSINVEFLPLLKAVDMNVWDEYFAEF